MSFDNGSGSATSPIQLALAWHQLARDRRDEQTD